jgi:hypothetical protein
VQARTLLHVLQELAQLGVRGDGSQVRASRQRPSLAVRQPHVQLEIGAGQGVATYSLQASSEKGLHCCNRLIIWHARQESNSRRLVPLCQWVLLINELRLIAPPSLHGNAH